MTIGRIYVALPAAFLGTLIVSTLAGEIAMSNSLLENSQLISGEEKSATYRITPSFDLDHKVDDSQLEDICTLENINGDITIAYYGDDSIYDFKDSRSCCNFM